MKRSYSIVLLLALAATTLLASLAQPVFAQDEEDMATMEVTSSSEEAKAHFQMGMDDATNIFFERAAGHFEEALKLDPDFAMASLMHATFAPGLNQAQRLEQVDAALANLSAASTEEMLVGMAVRENLRGNNAKRAALYEAAVALMPDDPNVAWLHAQTVGGGGSAERAEALRQVTERFPEEAAAYNILAYTLWGLGDEAGARQAVKKYMELAPDHPNSHDSYAELLQFSGMYNEAMKHYQKAVQLDPDYFAGYTGQAEVYVLMGQGDKAREVLKQAEPHAPTENARANLSRAVANTYFMEGNTKEGMKALRAAAEKLEAMDAKGLAAQAHREMAVAEAMFGKADDVKQHLQKAAMLQEPNAGYHLWATVAHGMAGHAEATREEADAFAEAVGEGSWTSALNGLAYLVAGEHEAAEAALMTSDLDAAMQRAIMARCQKEMGHEAEARRFKDSVMAANDFGIYNLGFAFAHLSMP